MLQLKDIYYTIGDRTLFDHLNLTIDAQDKVGLIGINGSGKSTLLRLINGEFTPNEGSISMPKGYLVDYLPQEPIFKDDSTIRDYVFSSDLPIFKILDRYETVLDALSTRPDDMNLSEELVTLQAKIDQLDGWELESQIKTILTKLNLPSLDTSTSTLSGGQKKRVALAAALLRPSDLLILDEPTNHLDDFTISWLEGYLKMRKNSLLLVTHDRYFLDRVTTRIVELDHAELFSYEGNYSTFVEKKAERIALAHTLEQKRQNLYRKELAWMRQGAQARSTKQKARIQRFYDIEDQSFRQDDGEVQLLAGFRRLGKKTIEAIDLSVGYQKDEPLIKNFSTLINADDRVGIIGPNGSGKTTLLNTLTQGLAPLSGSVEIGPTVHIGYYTQHFDIPDESMNLIDYIRETAEYVQAEDGSRVTAAIMLERFLFEKDTHYSPIAKLSGGEKRRLYLLKILMETPNVLILDEPTNDLDIDTLKALEDYLDDFKGIVLVVSHDRYFLDRTCRMLFVVNPLEKSVQIATGNYSDYIDKYGVDSLAVKDLSNLEQVANKEEDSTKNQDSTIKSPATNTSTQPRKLTYKEKSELEGLPNKIEKLESRLEELEELISTHQSDYTILSESMEEKDLVETELLEAMERLDVLSQLRS